MTTSHQKKPSAFFYKSSLILAIILFSCTSIFATGKPLADSLDDERAAVQANIEDMKAHEALIKAAGKNVALLIKDYDSWIKKNPKSLTLPLAIGTGLYDRELPEAKKYLLKAVELDPKLAKGWFMLSIDASRWGDEDAAMKYMGKASEADPADAGYAFYYAMDYEDIDGAVWRAKLYELAKKFPDNERGAQGLYWLAARSQDKTEKIKVYELLRQSYAPAKFNWSSSGMSGLYDQYLLSDPAKAAELAKTMGPKGGWGAKDTLAQNIGTIRGYLAANKTAEALELLKSVKSPRYSSAADMINLLKSEVYFASGNKEGAYDSLVKIYSVNPTDELDKAITKYASAINKDAAQIKVDIWKYRDLKGYEAPAFELDQYLKKGKASLADFKGKVVLLTFWFPGCGPCRGEFPHFENVIRKYDKNKVAYIGINVFLDQDEYVLPFMKGTKYSFIPLRATSEWAAEKYKVRGEPTNFLIDQNGKIVFANFRIDESNEQTLALMLNSTLDRPL